MTKVPHILVADDKEELRDILETAFDAAGYQVSTAVDGLDAITQMAHQAFDLVVTDLNMPYKDGMEVLSEAKRRDPDAKVIMVTAFGTMDVAVEAMRRGASDFITKPFKLAEIEHKVAQLLKADATPSGTQKHRPVGQSIVGESPQTRDTLRLIAKIGPSASAVLITGPTGTGKELVAHALHDASPRHEKPFVALNCAALAPGVLESELFGHEKGAFTGASDRRIGRFEQADGGTLFLDEVGEIDPGIQTKLLRVLQEGEIERVGGAKTIPVDVRIVAATNRDLTKAIEEGRFREDFYYRLNVFSIALAPLAARSDDIPALVSHFLHHFSAQTGKAIHEIEPEALEALCRYPWPGNIRQLQNILERAAVLCDGNRITTEEIPPELLMELSPLPPRRERFGTTAPPEPAVSDSLEARTERLEKEAIAAALEKCRWNKTKAAEQLGLKRTTLQYKIRKYGLE